MAKRSEAWKNLERSVALEARGAGFTRAFRVCRGDDIGVSAVDVILPEVPFVKIDTKYRGKGWSHHPMIVEAERKYCQKPGDFMILPTKGGREHGSFSTLRTEILMHLLASTYINKERPEDALGCPKCNGLSRPKNIGLNLSECTCQNCGMVFFIKNEDVPPRAEEAIHESKRRPEKEEHPLEVIVTDEDCQPQVVQKKRKTRTRSM